MVKLPSYQKKEAAFLRRKYDKLDYNLGGLRKMRKIPDVVIVVDPKRESTAIEECRKLRIKIVSILDTNCDPDLVDLAIPANDDSVDSIELIISTLASGILVGSHS
jgi:small subunit ribosomal protein S2